MAADSSSAVAGDAGTRPFRIYGTCLNRFPRPARDPAYARWFFEGRDNREYHAWREMVVCLSGTGPFGWADRLWTIEPRTALLVDRSESHPYLYPRTRPPFLHYWFCFGQSTLTIVESGAGPDRRLFSRGICRFSIKEGIYSEFLSAWETASAATEGARDPVCVRRLVAMADAVIADTLWKLRSRPAFESDRDQVLQTVISHIDAHPQGRLSLEEIARLAGYSKFHFHRTFSEATGETLHSYVTRRRLQHAKELLEHGHTCAAAAAAVGFADAPAFTRWFKHHTGVVPSRSRG